MMTGNCRALYLVCFFFLVFPSTNFKVNAQIIPDRTLGNEKSRITPINAQNDRIDGGAIRGSNLFHSFREFNISEGHSAYFANPEAINNIFSRVTGNNASLLLGKLGVLGNANLFLINPNGIIFGQNASLDIRAGMNTESIGKPLGTIGEDSGAFFDAPPQNNPVATSADITIGEVLMLPPDGLVLLTNQYKPNPLLSGGDITITGVGVLGILGIDARGFGGKGSHVFLDSRGDITLLTGSLIDASASNFLDDSGSITFLAKEDTVLESSVQLFAIGNNGNIRINTGSFSAARFTQINTSNVEKGISGKIGITARDRVSLNGSFLTNSVAGEAKGSEIEIEASQLDIENTSVMIANTQGAGEGGDVIIDVDRLIVKDGSSIFSRVFGTGNGGDISITASESIEVTGRSPSGLFKSILSIDTGSAQIQATGNSGNITINTSTLLVSERGTISSSSEGGTGNAGRINIDVDNLLVKDGGEILTITKTSGNGGILTITAKELVQVSGSFPDNSNVVSRLRASTEGNGKAGELTVTTQQLIVRDGAQISTSSIFGDGKGGNLTVVASELVELGGFPSGLFTSTQGKGDAGNLTINTAQLIFKDEAVINASTSGKGKGGNLTVNASKLVELLDPNSNEFASGLFASSEGEGDAGNLTIDTEQLIIRNGAQISTTTFDKGKGGSLTVNASEFIELLGTNPNGFASGLFAQTQGDGDAGNLDINTERLIIRDGALITATTFGKGKGGSLTVKASEFIELLGTDSDGFASGLFTSSQGQGNAGNLTVDTGQLSVQDGAVVSAASLGNGSGGIISINAPQLITLGADSKLTVETSGAGKPGDINISTDTLTIGEDAQLSATATATSTNTEGGGSITLNANNLSIAGKLGIFAETQSIAPAGDLIIQPLDGRGNHDGQGNHDGRGDLAPTLNIQFTDNGFISASTSADGQGGNITISAPQTIDIRGDGKITVETSGKGDAGTIDLTSQILTLADGLEISASTTGEGGAGNINLTAKTIDLSNGAQIRTNTAGSNNAGDINLKIAENLKLTGENTGIFADTAIDSLGNGGNISIDLSLLQIEDGATVSVDSKGKGIGGNINILSGDLNLNQGTILGQSASNQGGNITLKINNLLILNNRSQISTTAGTEKSGGDGGNISIDANFIIANPLQDSDITANAFTGRGGNINITTQGILGLQVRKETTNLSDITASSEFGLDGTININDPGVDPTTGLENLPQTSIEATVSQGCQVRKGKAAVEFYQLGKGGFPSSPNDWLTADPFSYEGLIPLETLASSFQKIDRVSFVPNGFALSCQK